MSTSHALGVLLTNDSDIHHFCGQVVDAASLDSVISDAFLAKTIEVVENSPTIDYKHDTRRSFPQSDAT
jgi:hypothetical protein